MKESERKTFREQEILTTPKQKGNLLPLEKILPEMGLGLVSRSGKRVEHSQRVPRHLCESQDFLVPRANQAIIKLMIAISHVVPSSLPSLETFVLLF